ncbi:protein COFACTOR ASSEMBLY OF COMPLEX C SUBUNIT B CCB2, chloroplastic isoform X1 [Prosopis cineraria]|uniref:protein COFACTOR ASSEMBLY OF COMPLEX C SUBUNIT B CCB2, chloroplastic isoform X1 n=1 Tax=Prosopis cineraria TaxID=364024 RepID=UPI0024108DDE|nr:protein COFACTOR ASSEMBLY OF COMPLEX C SUBUNIT B CCB2, chloroplastic isoform X1 [Prosopis cineraria]
MNGILSFSRSIPVKPVSPFRAKTGVRKSPAIIFARLEDSQQQQLNLSVLRFTLGIPGLDESYLPRWIGYGLGSLLLLNHFVDSGSTTIIPAQLTTEILGLSLASISIALPYFGKFLKGAQPAFQRVQPDGAEQIFVMSPNLAGIQKEDLAWASYVLLRNTNAIAALISIQGDICIRGYWNVPAENSSKESLLGWFQEKVEKAGLFDLKDTLYFPQEADSEFQELLPKGACSVLVQPLLQVSSQPANGPQNPEGFILLASTVTYAFSVKDRAWIAAAANKFSGTSRLTNL